MPPKRSKAAKSKDLGGRYKGPNRHNKNKKKKKHGSKKIGHATVSYTLLPKRKRLKKKVVTKLENENQNYTLARGVNAINRLDQGKFVEEANLKHPLEEQVWRKEKKEGIEHLRWKDAKTNKILSRAVNRRKKTEAKREQDLLRKKYRLHPHDAFHNYIRGYKKARHRITKNRFMTCVDIPLFSDVLNDNKDLIDSPLWADKLNLKNLSVEKAKQLKDHLHQFDVLVEGLKQGIFDFPGCDDFPLSRLRRKKKKKRKSISKHGKKRSRSNSRHHLLRRRLSFPPFESSKEKLATSAEPEAALTVLKGAISRVANWMKSRASFSATRAEITQLKAPQNDSDIPSSVSMTKESTQDDKHGIGNEAPNIPQMQEFKWARKTTLRSFLPQLKTQSIAYPGTSNAGDQFDEDEEQSAFADLLTIDVPEEIGRQKKFIRTLVERKNKKRTKKNNLKSAAAETAKQEEDEARQRHERAEKTDPLQRLHQDERDSEICSAISTTTTDGYASWRRPRDLRNAGNKQDILAHKVDTTFGWRVVLLLIVMWEIGCFVKRTLDDVYYWIFTSHLYRENIWLFEPSLFPSMDEYYVVHFQEWIHLIISGISLSIIHRENECVSLLFAFSMLFDGILEVAISTHDYVYLPEPIDWICVLLTALHIMWKVFIICLFIAYHYYSAGYIRKAREFKHRKIKLHNHEIKAKGTKGLQKRKMAWSWMTRHARDTNLRHLKRKYPDVKDGNFPEDQVAKEIKFSEAKELRLYTQNHNLNIGYPYNKLHDMRRYVFEKLEKSDYTDNDDKEERQILRKKLNKIARKSSQALTTTRWQAWKKVRAEKERLARSARMSFIQAVAAENEEPRRKSIPAARRSILKSNNLTISADYSHKRSRRI